MAWTWHKVNGGLKQISVGSAKHIWGVNAANEVFRYTGENEFEKIDGGLKQVSVGIDGTVLGVDPKDEIYRWLGQELWF